jgi:hypothetical protein
MSGPDGPRRRRYGLLLSILLTSYLLSALIHGKWIPALELALFVMAAILALRDSPPHRTAARITIIVALAVSVAMIAISASISTSAGKGVAAIWTALVLLITVAALVRQILQLPTVTIQSIFGAVSAYMIIGLMFAAWYSAIYNLHGSFFADHEPGTASTFQYFSFSTLTTLGYGDFTAAGATGRAIAMIEAMSGQIFLATLVARLVAAFRPASAANSTDRDQRSNQ